MLLALIVGGIALVQWSPIGAGYAFIWAFLWLAGVPLLGMCIYAWRSVSRRSNRSA